MSKKDLTQVIFEMLDKNNKRLMCLVEMVGVAENNEVILLKLRSIYLLNVQIQKMLLEYELKKLTRFYLDFCPKNSKLWRKVSELIPCLPE